MAFQSELSPATAGWRHLTKTRYAESNAPGKGNSIRLLTSARINFPERAFVSHYGVHPNSSRTHGVNPYFETVFGDRASSCD